MKNTTAQEKEIQPMDALREILDLSGFKAEVQIGEHTIQVPCRRLPFATVTRVISQLSATVQMELRASSSVLADKIQAAAERSARVEGEEKQTFGYEIIGQLIPHILRLVQESPDLMRSILKDVVIDSTDEFLDNVAAEIGLAVIIEAFKKMDKAVLAKQVDDLFFGVSEMMTGLGKIIKTKE